MPRAVSCPAGLGEVLCVQVPPNAPSALTLRMTSLVGADRTTTSIVVSPLSVSYSQRALPSTASHLWTLRTLCAAGSVQPMAVTTPGTATMSAASLRVPCKDGPCFVR